MPSTAVRTLIASAVAAVGVVVLAAAVAAAPPPEKGGGGGGGGGKPKPSASASPSSSPTASPTSSPTSSASPSATATSEPTAAPTRTRTFVAAGRGYELMPRCYGLEWGCDFGHRYPWVETHGIPAGATLVFTADKTGRQICTAVVEAPWGSGGASCTRAEWDIALQDLEGAGFDRTYTATYAGDDQHLPSSGTATMTDVPVSFGVWETADSAYERVRPIQDAACEVYNNNRPPIYGICQY